jgi:hypothetical protein
MNWVRNIKFRVTSKEIGTVGKTGIFDVPFRLCWTMGRLVTLSTSMPRRLLSNYVVLGHGFKAFSFFGVRGA